MPLPQTVHLVVILLAGFAVFPVGLLRAESLTREAERKRAPDFELKDADGNVVRLSDYKGKVVLIDFWATWCVPCKTEIPWFNEFERNYKDQGFAVIGISMDEEGWTKITPFRQRRPMEYRVLLGDTKTAYKYGDVKGLPVAFLIDREGRLAAVHFGLVSKKKVEQEIKKLLESPVDSK